MTDLNPAPLRTLQPPAQPQPQPAPRRRRKPPTLGHALDPLKDQKRDATSWPT